MNIWARVLSAVGGVVMLAFGLLLLEGKRLGDVLGVGGGMVMLVGGLLVLAGSVAYEWQYRRRRDNS